MSIGYLIFLIIGIIIVYFGYYISESLFSNNKLDIIESFNLKSNSNNFYTDDFLSYFYSNPKSDFKFQKIDFWNIHIKENYSINESNTILN